MEERRYITPGWMAIAAAALTFPMIVLGLVLDILARKSPAHAVAFLVPYLFVVLAQTFCGLFALARLKTLLNERHGFHDVDGLILAIIIGVCVMTLVAMSGRVLLVLLGANAKVALFFVPVIILIGIPLAVMSIVFAVRLLSVGSDLTGLLKPFVYVTIAAAVCFATFILAPVGFLLDAASNVILGMIFLRGGGTPAAPDFV